MTHGGNLEAVRSKYGAVAESSLSSNEAGVMAVAEAFGYSAEELTSIPAGANMGLSCGNPTAAAHLQPGEIVVDLGSGGGLDVFLAAKMVGPQGRDIGIDMTSAMIDRARANALAGEYRNVEFHLATIDAIPLPDAVARSMAAYVGCIGGAISMDDYRSGLTGAGFEHVQIVESGTDLNAYAKVENQSGCCSPAMDQSSCCTPAPNGATLHHELADLLSKFDVNAAAASVKVYAIKPRANTPGEQNV